MRWLETQYVFVECIEVGDQGMVGADHRLVAVTAGGARHHQTHRFHGCRDRSVADGGIKEETPF